MSCKLGGTEISLVKRPIEKEKHGNGDLFSQMMECLPKGALRRIRAPILYLSGQDAWLRDEAKRAWLNPELPKINRNHPL